MPRVRTALATLGAVVLFCGAALASVGLQRHLATPPPCRDLAMCAGWSGAPVGFTVLSALAMTALLSTAVAAAHTARRHTPSTAVR